MSHLVLLLGILIAPLFTPLTTLIHVLPTMQSFGGGQRQFNSRQYHRRFIAYRGDRRRREWGRQPQKICILIYLPSVY